MEIKMFGKQCERNEGQRRRRGRWRYKEIELA